MSQTLTVQPPEVGQVVHVRGGVYMVTDIEKTVFPPSLQVPLGGQSHLISSTSLMDDALCDASECHINHVVLDTIRRFKGLESPCVLLVLDAKSAEQNTLLYTGVSRAQSVLEIFAPPQVQFSQ